MLVKKSLALKNSFAKNTVNLAPPVAVSVVTERIISIYCNLCLIVGHIYRFDVTVLTKVKI